MKIYYLIIFLFLGVAGDGLAVVYVKQSGQTDKIYYAHKDHLGSIIKLTDAAGTEVFKAAYDPWGNRKIFNSTFNFHRGFTGHEHLPEFNLINMNGRLYDPQLGSFLSPDPFVQMPDFSQNFNRYAYCLNNPLKYTDPDGEFFWMAAVIGFIVSYVSYGITNDDWGGKAFGQGLIGAGISLVGFGAGYAAMAGAEAIGMSAGLAGLTSGAIGGAVAGGVSAGIYGGNIGQGMLAGGFGGLMGSAVNMGSVGESFIKRGIASTLTGSVAGGFTAGFLGGDVRQGMRNGAVSGAVGFMTTWAGEYLQKTIISQKYAEEIMEIDREYRKQLENYGSEKINVTNNLPDPDKVLWNRLEAVYEKYGVPIDWLRSRDYDSKAILKFGKMHIRYGSDKMVNPTAYGRKADRSAYGLKSNQINVHYDKFDVIKYPVLHLYFDTYKQGRLGVH